MPSSGVQTCALRSEEHTSELQSHDNLVCRLLLEKTIVCGQQRSSTPPCSARCRRAASARQRRGHRRRPGRGVLVVSERLRLCRARGFFLKGRPPPKSPVLPFRAPPPP